MLKFFTVNRTIFILSLLGFFVSSFLAYEYLQPTPIVCPITGTGCEAVKLSAYSKFFGISIPYLGIAFYFFMASLCVLTSHKFNKLVYQLQFLATLVAFLFSVYLTYLEGFVIKAYCFWCLTSALITTIILVTFITEMGVKDENRD